MKILAVSDIEDKALEELIQSSSEKLKIIDFIVSCGDLQRKYLEYVVDGVGKPLFFVSGNHFVSQFYEEYLKSPKNTKKLYKGKGAKLRFGGIDMHARVETYGNYIIAGFGGSMRYNPGNFQFNEHEMAKIVKKSIKKIRNRRFKDFISFKRKKEIIIISHAPVEGVHDKDDVCHKGFKCFRDLIDKVKPIVWMHGHIHPEGQEKHQQSVVNKTLVINVIPSKIVELKKKRKVFIRQVYNN